MPQLDRIIVFTQIFWLFLVFTALYVILIYFFFPSFLRSLRARTLVIESNNMENNTIKTDFLSTQDFLNQTAHEQLRSIKVFLLNDFTLFKNVNSFDLHLLDTPLLNSIFYTTLYTNKIILFNIPLNSKI